MKNTIGYIIIGVCLAIGIIIGLRGCESKPGPNHAQDKAYVDSIADKAHKDSIAAANKMDILTDSLNEMRRANDYLHWLQQQQEGIVNKAGGQISGLIQRIDSLKAKNDVLGQLAGCDSLRDLYEGAAKIVGGYEYLSDSLINRLKLERGLSDSTKNYLYSMFSEANNSLFDISRKYNNLYSDYQKVNVKPKRFGIGPSGGIFATNKGLGYGFGISVTYNLIRF